MTDLKIDTVVLREAGSALRVVATELEHADSNSERAADAVGEDDLADRIRDFADNWDDKRSKMLKNIGTLADKATAIGETYEQLERDLVDVLTGKSQ